MADSAHHASTPPLGKRAEKRRRDVRAIVDATRKLADDGGFEGVRLRDVAANANVSMGALYRCFQSKEEILLYAFAEDFTGLEQRVAARPPEGATPLDRVEAFFRVATRGVVQRPNYGKALIAATASGQLAAARQMATLHARMSHLIATTMFDESSRAEPSDAEFDASGVAAGALNRVWFSALIAWASGFRTIDEIIVEIRNTAALLLLGVDAQHERHHSAAAGRRSS